MNKSQSWVNFFALSLSDPTPITFFVRNHEYLDKIPFCHLIPYCKPKPSTIIAKIQKFSTNPTGIKYKFGVKVPNGIKNANNLDKKSGSNQWEQALKTELKNLTDYQTFIVLDSGESIPNEYQKIPYHMVFDIKYDLRHKE